MRIKIIMFACLIAINNAASAQNAVNLTGIIDVGYVAVNTGKGYTKMIQSGNSAGSRITYFGSEDLGSGNKASYVLEQGFFADSGISNATFFRRSIVSLEGSAGKVDLGRDYNPLFSVLVRTDPMSAGTLASATGFQASAGAQANNAVFYTSPTSAGVTVKLMHSVGESTTGPADNGNRQGANLFWTAGDVVAFGAWGSQKTAVGTSKTATVDSQALVGLQYKLAGNGWLTGMYQSGKNNSGTAAFNSNNGVAFAKEYSTILLGAKVPVSQALSLAATYQIYDDKTALNRDATNLGLAAFYSLSKRTTLYGNVATISNKNGQKFTLVDSGRNSYNYTPALGSTVKPIGYAMGIKHVF